MKKNQKQVRIVSILALLALIVGFSPKFADAANFQEASMRLDRMTTSVTDNQILVVAKPATSETEASVRVSFDSGFGVDTTATNITVSTSGIPSSYQGESLTAWPGIGSAATGVSGQDVNIASDDLTVGTLYGFYITAGIDNPSSAGQYKNTITTRTSGPSTIDSSKVAVRIISDDQIVITAIVPPTFNFTLDGNTDSFTTDLDPASVVSTGGRTVTIATNAADGWIAWARSANTSLDSANTGETIETTGSIDNTPSTLSAGSDGYVMDVDLITDSGTGDGTVSIAPEYNGSESDQGGTLSSTYQEIATCDGTTNGDVLTLYGRATISAIKAAAEDYTDTWTVIGAGNF